jgi:hypothetical protein
MSYRVVRGSQIMVLAVMLGILLTLPATQAAGQSAETARVMRVAGRVEILHKDQQAWVPASVGALLAVGAEIRAFEGGWAELRLADGSSVVLAENSRLVVTRLEIDQQTGRRASVFHLVVGKVRAVIGRGAFTLIRFRESDFAITTPTAVAAARGTDWSVMNVATTSVVVHDGEILCLDLQSGILAPISAFIEALRCSQLRTISQSYDQLVRSTTFPDTKQIQESLSDRPTRSVTDPSLGQLGAPLASSSTSEPTFLGTTGWGPTVLPNISETTTRQLR